jgi:hypothetical protein
LHLPHQLSGDQLKLVHVVQLRVVLVQADQQLGGELALHPDQLCLHAVERGQIAVLHGLQVDVMQMPVLIPAGVLLVQQMPAVVRPRERPDAAVGIVGDKPGLAPVDAVVAGGCDPDVENAVVRRDPGQPGPVGRQPRTDPLGIAEQYGGGNEVNHVWLPIMPRPAARGRRPRLSRSARPAGLARPARPEPLVPGVHAGTAPHWQTWAAWTDTRKQSLTCTRSRPMSRRWCGMWAARS